MCSFKRLATLVVLFATLCLMGMPASAEGDHITILNMDDTTPRFQKAVQLFHQRYPDVEVIVKSEQDSRVISTGMMSKNGDIDLLMTYEMFNPMPTYQYFASGAIEDLSQYPEITQYLPEYVDRFSACMVDGHLIAIPEQVYLEAFVVNDALATKMGIEIPDDAWTWADFKAIGEQVLQYNQENGTSYSLFHDNLNAPYCLHLLVTNAIDVMGATSHFTDEPYQQGMEAWLWAVKSELVMDASKFRDPMGKALFTYKTGLIYGNMGTTHYLLPPAFSDTTRFKMSNSAVMMNANSRHKEEAVYFLSCFFSPDAIGMEPIETLGPWFLDESRHFSQPGWKAISPENSALWDALIQRSVMPSLIGSIWQDLLFELYPALVDGQLTVPQFLQQAERRANLMLGE